MGLPEITVQPAKYEFEGIKSTDDVNPESVVKMLEDVRESIGEYDSSFGNLPLKKVLEIVESKEYTIAGIVPIDLGSAYSIIEAYKALSGEGDAFTPRPDRETYHNSPLETLLEENLV